MGYVTTQVMDEETKSLLKAKNMKTKNNKSTWRRLWALQYNLCIFFPNIAYAYLLRM